MNKIGLNEDTLDKTTRLYIDEQDKRIAQLEEENAILHEAGGIDAKERDHLREVIQERNQKIDELTKRVEHEATKFTVAFAAKCKAEQDQAELEKENQLLMAEVKLWKASSENNFYKAFQLQKENAELKGRLNAINILTPELQKISKGKDEQLTKAKVALQNVIDYLGQFCSDYPDCVIEAEQFLNSEVEK